MVDLLQMIGDADFAYSQARIQARHGARLTEQAWRRLEATHDVAQYVHALRATGRARWVERITADMSSHALEARLRAEWRAYTDEVARFQPERWQAAVAWTAYLVDLPVVDHLRHGGAFHRWMAEDGIYALWSGTDPHEREQALAGTPLAALAHETAAGVSAVVTWLDVWRRLWPNASAAHSRALESIVTTVGEHVALLDSPAATSSFELRTALSQRLGTLFRRHFETAAATIAHLLLEALDLERVRAGLVRRVLVEPLRPDAA